MKKFIFNNFPFSSFAVLLEIPTKLIWKTAQRVSDMSSEEISNVHACVTEMAEDSSVKAKDKKFFPALLYRMTVKFI